MSNLFAVSSVFAVIGLIMILAAIRNVIVINRELVQIQSKDAENSTLPLLIDIADFQPADSTNMQNSRSESETVKLTES